MGISRSDAPLEFFHFVSKTIQSFHCNLGSEAKFPSARHGVLRRRLWIATTFHV